MRNVSVLRALSAFRPNALRRRPSNEREHGHEIHRQSLHCDWCSGRLGEAAAEEFAAGGGKVVLSDISEDAGREAVAALSDGGAEAIFVKADASKEEDIQRLVQETVERFGSVDVMVANAGINAEAPLHEIELSQWQKIIDINLTGVFLCNRHAVRQMLAQGRGGAIVNMGSIHSFVARDGLTSYASSKGGVKMLTQSGASHYARDRIRVNMVCPAYIEGPLTDALDPDVRSKVTKLHPMGRLGLPEEVAKAVAFLASDDASFIIGSQPACRWRIHRCLTNPFLGEGAST